MESTGPTGSSFDVSGTAILEYFSLYPNVIKAKLICVAAELEQVDQPDATQIYHSSYRLTMMWELHYINELSTRLQQPSLKTELSQIVACLYLDSKQKSLPIPSQVDPMILFTEQHHDTVKEKQPNDLEVHSNISVPPKPIIQK